MSYLNTSWKIPPAYLKIICVFLLILFFSMGVFLRLQQLSSQTLLDDEWHALFSISKYTTFEILTTFGYADHSIPLTLYDHLISHIVPLNEWLMRLPLLISGLLFLLLVPLYFIQKKAPVHALLITLLLCLSPVLIQYSRMARPYMLSILLGYVAHLAFINYWNNYKPVLNNLIFSLSGALAIWLISIAGFFIIAPFIYILPQLFSQANQSKLWIKVFKIGVPFTLLTSALLIPPLIYSMDQLLVKTGKSLPTVDTLTNVWFWWYGIKSNLLTVALVLLALFGIQPSLKRFDIARTALLGCLLIVLGVYLSQPNWVFHARTFGRYLIFFLPLLYLFTVSGLIRLSRYISIQPAIPVISMCSICILMFYNSPMPQLLQTPNNETLNSYYTFHSRPEKNTIKKHLDQFPQSNFWAGLKQQPQTQKIAVAPFYYATYNWPAPIWQNLSKQTIVPAFLNGFCMPEQQKGEAQHALKHRIWLDNAVYMASLKENSEYLKQQSINWFVWLKGSARPAIAYYNFDQCDRLIPDQLGIPDYQDEYLEAYQID